MYSQWFLYSTAITTIHTGSPGHKLAILAIQAFLPLKHLLFASFTSIGPLIEKLSVLLDCCECSSFGCIDVSHAFKPHVAPRPNVCILDQVMSKTRLRTADDSRILPSQIIPNHIICHSSYCPKLMPMKLCRFFHQD